MKITYDTLPQAAEHIIEKIDAIENLLSIIYNPTKIEPPPEVLNFEQAHKLLQNRGVFIKRSTLYKKSSQGSVPFQKMSGRLVFKRSELEQWVEEQAQHVNNKNTNTAVVKTALKKHK